MKGRTAFLLVAAVLVALAAVVLARDVPAAMSHAKEAVKEGSKAYEAATKDEEHPGFFDKVASMFGKHEEPAPPPEPESRNLWIRVKDSMHKAAVGLGLADETEENEEEEENNRSFLSRLSLSPFSSDVTLGDRLRSLFSSSPSASDKEAEEEQRWLSEHIDSGYLSDELAKATGLKAKSLGDKVADVLEGVGIKHKTPEKQAAEEAIERFHDKYSAEDTTEPFTLSPLARSRLQRFLEWTGLRQKSALERAQAEYGRALHNIKVQLGAENPTLAERLSNTFGSARESVATAGYTASDFLRGRLFGRDLSEEEAAAPNVLERAKSQWNDVTARAASSIIDARDSVASGYDSALKAAGIRERSKLEKAKTGFDRATHRILLALGVHEPTMTDRFTSYTSSGAAMTQPVRDWWDRTLKTLHLREPSGIEKARSKYDAALHSLKVALKLEDATTAEKVNGILENARAQMADAMASLHFPGTGPEGVTGAARHAYYDSLASARAAMEKVNRQTDAALKAAGIRDKTVLEKVRDGLSGSYHEALTSLGLEEPSLLQRVRTSLPTSLSDVDAGLASGQGVGHGGGVWDRLLKTLHLREPSGIEKARSKYDAALHSLKVALKLEDATTAEKVNGILENARKQMNDAISSLSSLSPLPSPSSATGEGLTDAAKAQYQEGLRKAAEAMAAVRKNTDRALKKAGIRDKNALEKLQDGLSESYHDAMLSLGLHEPSFYERITGSVSGVSDSLSNLSPKKQFAFQHDGIFTRTLKALGLKRKTAAEMARDSYLEQVNKLQALLKSEEPSITQRVLNSLDSARQGVVSTAQYVSSLLPDKEREYDEGSRETMKSLLTARNEINRLLKNKNVKDRDSLKAARDELEESLDAVWAAFGFHEPSFLDRMRRSLLGALPGFNYQDKYEAAIDAQGDQVLEKPGILSRIKSSILGG